MIRTLLLSQRTPPDGVLSYMYRLHREVIVSMERWVWFVHLVTFVREEDLVEYLSGLVLDGVYLHEMRWVSTGTSAAGEGEHTILTTTVSPSLSLPLPPPSPSPSSPSPFLSLPYWMVLYRRCCISVARGCLCARVLRNKLTSFCRVELHGNMPGGER